MRKPVKHPIAPNNYQPKAAPILERLESVFPCFGLLSV